LILHRQTIMRVATACFVLGFVFILLACGNSSERTTSKPDVEVVEAPRKTETNLEDGANPPEPGSLVDESVRNLPDTGLVNQDGKAVSPELLRGSPVLMSFIYTRCPDKKMCPLITQKMARVQDRISNSSSVSPRYVAVTFDPSYDTPSVLRTYGKRYELNYDTWSFWTGNVSTIRTIADRFKIHVRREDQMPVTHNMRTYLIDSEGVVKFWYRGSDWAVKDVARRLRELGGNQDRPS